MLDSPHFYCRASKHTFCIGKAKLMAKHMFLSGTSNLERIGHSEKFFHGGCCGLESPGMKVSFITGREMSRGGRASSRECPAGGQRSSEQISGMVE